MTGLAGIRADARRPLLNLRRSETRRLCVELGLAVVDDPSNHDPRFRRNRVRHELLPLFDDIAERDVAGVVARQAQSLAEIDQYLRDSASSIDVTDARALAAAPEVLARVAVRHWLVEHRPGSAGEHPPDAAAVERVLAVARGEATGTEVGGGWSVKRTDWRLRLVSGAQSGQNEPD